MDNIDGDADELVRVASSLVASLQVKDGQLQSTLDAVVSAAAELCGFQAGLILIERGQLVPKAVTGPAPQVLDALQQQTGLGPCVEAAERQEPLQMLDSRSEARWPGFGERACEIGVLSMLCVPLWVDAACPGTLSLYADRPAAFTAQDERVARICATLAAVAVASSQQGEQLRTALANRDVIGQAKGILMERHKLTPDAAFAALRRMSQSHNRKLLAVAQHLIDTGELVGDSEPVPRG